VTVERQFERVAVVVHPTRAIDDVLAALERWTRERGLEVVQPADAKRRVAPVAELEARDLVVALGGDGTVLAALRMAAAVNTAVLGVACGSIGALTAVAGIAIADALDRVWAGDWTPRSLPALAVADDWAVNDFVVLRRGAGQVAASVTVDNELYVRLAGDGLIVATALGSSAYSMAAGGPVLAAGTPAYVCTPLAMHGGSASPLVVPPEATLTVDVQPGYSGFDIEIDGRRKAPAGNRFQLTLQPDHATLVTFRPAGRGLDVLRGRRLVTDSPRIVARDERAAGSHS
jgi:NAD+ kinase